jgi:hypothetical protein
MLPVMGCFTEHLAFARIPIQVEQRGTPPNARYVPRCRFATGVTRQSY